MGSLGLSYDVMAVLLAAAVTRTLTAKPPAIERVLRGLRYQTGVGLESAMNAVLNVTRKLLNVSNVGSGLSTAADDNGKLVEDYSNREVAYSTFPACRFPWEHVVLKAAADRLVFSAIFGLLAFVFVSLAELVMADGNASKRAPFHADVVLTICIALVLAGPAMLLKARGWLHSSTALAVFTGLAAFVASLACLHAPARLSLLDAPVARALADCSISGVASEQEASELAAGTWDAARWQVDAADEDDVLAANATAAARHYFLVDASLPLPHARYMAVATVAVSAVVAILVALLASSVARSGEIFVIAMKHATGSGGKASWTARALANLGVATPLLAAGLFTPYLAARPPGIAIVENGKTSDLQGTHLLTLTESQWLSTRLVIIICLCMVQLSQVRRGVQTFLRTATDSMRSRLDTAAAFLVSSVGARKEAKPTGSDAFAANFLTKGTTHHALMAAAVSQAHTECGSIAVTTVVEVAVVAMQLLATPVVTLLLCAFLARRGAVGLGVSAAFEALRIAIKGSKQGVVEELHAGADALSAAAQAVAAADTRKQSSLSAALQEVFGADALTSPALRVLQPDVARPILVYILAFVSISVFIMLAAAIVFHEGWWPSFTRGSAAASANRPAAVKSLSSELGVLLGTVQETSTAGGAAGTQDAARRPAETKKGR